MQPKDKGWRVLVHRVMLVNCVSQSGTQCEQMSISGHSLFLLSSVFCLVSTFKFFSSFPTAAINRRNIEGIAAEASQLEYDRDTSGPSITGLHNPISQKEDRPVGTVRKRRKPWDWGGPCAPLELEQPWCVSCLLCPGRRLPPQACWLCRCRDNCYSSCYETLNRLPSQ